MKAPTWLKVLVCSIISRREEVVWIGVELTIRLVIVNVCVRAGVE